MPNDLPKRARAVIIGGGIVGYSVAYHLTQLGLKDVVLLEQFTMAAGTTGHGAGLVTQLRHTRALTDLSRYAADLYSRLEAETGQPTGFKQTGSITVARTQGRADEIKRTISMAKGFGVEIHGISPREAGELWPLMNTDDIVGAMWVPKDGQTTPDATTMAMGIGATRRGATILDNVTVTGIQREGGTVTRVNTSRGDIECEIVVNCAGMWAREIGLMAGVAVPLHAAEHAYLVTRPMEGVTPDMPSLRDPDGYIYFRRDIEDQGGMLMGGFEPVAQPWGMGGIPDHFAFGRIDANMDRYGVFVENALQRAPTMADVDVLRWVVGPESFTPDNRYIMGEAPELRNFYVAAGLNSSGIAGAAGAGKAVAEWIVEGHPQMDLSEVDIRRFHGFENGSKYLYDRTVEGLGLLYATHWPKRQPETARMARQSPLHDRLTAAGAAFGELRGWERPNWFAPEGVEPRYEYSYQRQNWFPYSAEEHRAVRETAGLFDQTSFAKFLLQGPDAESVLQRICANDVGVEPGHVVYTAILNERGGIEADLTVTRMAEDQYMIVTGGGVARQNFTWIKSHIPDDARAYLTDVSSAYATLSVMGPNARAILSGLTDADLSNEAFPFLASKEITIAYAPVRATRVTYVGELGWEIYVATEFIAGVYDAIIEAGRAHGLRHAGYHAMDSLRIEKAYRSWGHDIVGVDTPLEAGLRFAVAFDKDGGFIGKDALLTQLDEGIKRRLAVFVLDDPEPILLGDEPIYRDGEQAGVVTSGEYGHTIGTAIGLGYVESEDGVTPAYIRAGTYEIEIATERFAAKVRMTAPYDPKGLRVHM